MEEPIRVPASPIPPIVASLIRQMMLLLGGILISRGWLEQGTLDAIIAAVPMILAVIWSIWSAYDKQKKASAMARLLPDSIAQEKRL